MEDNDTHFYQGIKLSHFETAIDVEYQYNSVINLLTQNINSPFSDLQESSLFRNMIKILGVKTWPTSVSSSFAEREMNDIVDEFSALLSRNNCDCGYKRIDNPPESCYPNSRK